MMFLLQDEFMMFQLRVKTINLFSDIQNSGNHEEFSEFIEIIIIKLISRYQKRKFCLSRNRAKDILQQVYVKFKLDIGGNK